MRAHQITHRLHADVPGEDEERHGNQLLGATLGSMRSGSRARHQPQHDRTGSGFDHAVSAESDQRDRSRHHARADRDGGLDQMPAQPNPRKPSRAPHQPRSLGRGRGDRHDGQRSAGWSVGAHP